jgi:hypothetical protein
MRRDWGCPACLGRIRIRTPADRTGPLVFRATAPRFQSDALLADNLCMTTDLTLRVPARLHALAATAMLLERLERTPRSASAKQYRDLVRQLEGLLAEADQEPTLPALLQGLPALAEMHENRRFEHAGLCMSPFPDAFEASRQADELMTRLRQHLPG